MGKKNPTEADMPDRFQDYLKQGEAAAMYMHGLADAWEASGATAGKSLIHHLRCHAEELGLGTLWVRDGYKEIGETKRTGI